MFVLDAVEAMEILDALAAKLDGDPAYPGEPAHQSRLVFTDGDIVGEATTEIAKCYFPTTAFYNAIYPSAAAPVVIKAKPMTSETSASEGTVSGCYLVTPEKYFAAMSVSLLTGAGDMKLNDLNFAAGDLLNITNFQLAVQAYDFNGALLN